MAIKKIEVEYVTGKALGNWTNTHTHEFKRKDGTKGKTLSRFLGFVRLEDFSQGNKEREILICPVMITTFKNKGKEDRSLLAILRPLGDEVRKNRGAYDAGVLESLPALRSAKFGDMVTENDKEGAPKYERVPSEEFLFMYTEGGDLLKNEFGASDALAAEISGGSVPLIVSEVSNQMEKVTDFI